MSDNTRTIEHPSWEMALFRAWTATGDPNDHHARTWLASPECAAEQIIERVRALEDENSRLRSALDQLTEQHNETYCIFRYGPFYYMCPTELREHAFRDVRAYFTEHAVVGDHAEEWPDFPDYVKHVRLVDLEFRCPTH